ncbi:MAG: hypothetical protein AAFN04_10580 [Pseudomonadota bacterium]
MIAGSHRLHNQSGELSSKELKCRLMKEKYFRSLFDPNRQPIEDIDITIARISNIDLKVVELVGQVGDVFLMDLRVLHTPAPNCSDKARMMLTCRFPLSTIAARFGSAASTA